MGRKVVHDVRIYVLHDVTMRRSRTTAPARISAPTVVVTFVRPTGHVGFRVSGWAFTEVDEP